MEHKVLSNDFEVVCITGLPKVGDQYGVTGLMECWAIPKGNLDKLHQSAKRGGYCGDYVISEKDLVALGGFRVKSFEAVIVYDFNDLEDEEREFLEEGEDFESDMNLDKTE